MSNIPTKSETCLCLLDFPVKTRKQNYQTTVELYANELNTLGQVTNNRAFIEAVQAEVHVGSNVELAQKIIGIAQSKVGSRLTRVGGTVHAPGPMIPIKHETNRSLPDPHRHRCNLPGHFEMKGNFMSTRLVQAGVCGGFDGEFKYDLVLDTRMRVGSDVSLHRRIEKLFYNDKTFRGSCEELARALVSAVHELRYSVFGIRARVYNTTGWAQVVWLEGMEIPPFLTEAQPGEGLAETAKP